MPPVTFGEPDPRDDESQRWWHIPIHVERPNNKLISFFTRTEIVKCHADVTFKQWNRDKFLMRWESDNLNGAEHVTLEYHPAERRRLIKVLPIAVRRCFKTITLERGESRVTDSNFILHGIKTDDNLLQNNTGYYFVLTLWSPEYPRWSISKRYALIVPNEDENNEEFTLSPLKD